MNRIYQWLSERTSFFRSDTSSSDRSSDGTSRTACTEVTVRQERMTVLVRGETALLDFCPLCGSKLAPAQAEQARARLLKGSISQEAGPLDDRSPQAPGKSGRAPPRRSDRGREKRKAD
jgi:hypothetical protein